MEWDGIEHGGGGQFASQSCPGRLPTRSGCFGWSETRTRSQRRCVQLRLGCLELHRHITLLCSVLCGSMWSTHGHLVNGRKLQICQMLSAFWLVTFVMIMCTHIPVYSNCSLFVVPWSIISIKIPIHHPSRYVTCPVMETFHPAVQAKLEKALAAPAAPAASVAAAIKAVLPPTAPVHHTLEGIVAWHQNRVVLVEVPWMWLQWFGRFKTSNLPVEKDIA